MAAARKQPMGPYLAPQVIPYLASGARFLHGRCSSLSSCALLLAQGSGLLRRRGPWLRKMVDSPNFQGLATACFQGKARKGLAWRRAQAVLLRRRN
jgi:hypothetical protein